jgi:hypothetical protein
MFDDLIVDLGHVSLLTMMDGLIVGQVNLGRKSKRNFPFRAARGGGLLKKCKGKAASS